MPYPIVAFPVVSSATTASPNLVTQIVSPNPKLLAITRAVVLQPEADRVLVEVYRDSKTAPGFWSCDVHLFGDGKLGPLRERREKCAPSQVPPPGAKCRRIDGVDYYTLHEVTDAEANALRRLVASLTRP